MHVERAVIEDFRCLKHVSVDLVQPRDPGRVRNVTLLVGRNGAGKTSVLRALCIGLVGEALDGYRSHYNVRRAEGVTAARVELTVRPGRSERDLFPGAPTLGATVHGRGAIEKLESHAPNPAREALYREKDPRLFVAAYGAARRVETGEYYDAASRERSRHDRYRRVASLLESQYTLVPLASWWPRLGPERRDHVAQVLHRLLPPSGLRVDRKAEEEPAFVGRGGQRLPFAALSDGYQAFLGWAADLLYHLHQAAPDGPLDAVEGLVLVDEVDLHLHPRWQQLLVGRLAKALPRLQFVLTTHSPLVVGSVESRNLRVLDLADKTGLARLRQPAEEVWGLSSDQVLLSPTFGLVTVREASFMAELRDREREAASDPRKALEFTRMIAYGAAGMGDETPEEAPDWVRSLARDRER